MLCLLCLALCLSNSISNRINDYRLVNSALSRLVNHIRQIRKISERKRERERDIVGECVTSLSQSGLAQGSLQWISLIWLESYQQHDYLQCDCSSVNLQGFVKSTNRAYAVSYALLASNRCSLIDRYAKWLCCCYCCSIALGNGNGVNNLIKTRVCVVQ